MVESGHFKKKTLIIIGNDKIGRRAYLKISRQSIDLSAFDFAIDASTNIFKIYRLITSGRIPFQCFTKMAFSELIRKNYPPIDYRFAIRSNNDFYKFLKENRYRQVIIFRGGLVINKKNLSLGVPFLNVHCARIPKYGGLCSIFRALKDDVLDQRCCLHVVTTTIDDPSEILDTEPYVLDSSKSYFWNEEGAYEAGIRLLTRFIKNAQ